ncbi:adenosylcobinamide-phosphate synthase CbiB [Gracilinema caldarium]|uniref:Cobalamin biosynthesis protein CobD n=1 Tax=Gracilinema caldarium (strain ATCC 51460 / DSM 7334 / H1) TaxID=744872 RepID=F8F392_GRAC1|nr:adenosylcobinamide-phosphate synthase CbiB [Gracilinema caldarium]AEJ20418.1 Cobalamin biosynthesis protein cbiB [Gracilinema caldarium DSM 7334]
MNKYESLFAIFAALGLDFLIGDPVFALHPVRLLGNLACKAETWSRRLLGCESSRVSNGTREKALPILRLRLAGMLSWFIVTIPAACIPLAGHRLLLKCGFMPVFIWDSLIIWASFAIKDLVQHAREVTLALERDVLENKGGTQPHHGRKAVSLLVGRDPEKLDSEGVARACIESVAESSVDSIASPLLYAVLLGPWAALLYRAINTMDSIFGHKNDRYRYFGWWAARSDDVANFIPARFSALAACLCASFVGGSILEAWNIFITYRKAHESPNSGHPEAAYAGVLNLKLGGPTWYPEGLVDKPWIHPEGKAPDTSDIARALRLLYWNTAVTILVLSLCFLAFAVL